MNGFFLKEPIGSKVMTKKLKHPLSKMSKKGEKRGYQIYDQKKTKGLFNSSGNVFPFFPKHFIFYLHGSPFL